MSATVLIVEDEPALRDVFSMVLTSGGHTVVTAHNGLDGLEKLKHSRAQLVLLDIFMPVMDGKEFLRNVNLSDYPGTKIIVYSNISDQQTETEVVELGAHSFVLKSSMTPRDLLDLVDRETAQQ